MAHGFRPVASFRTDKARVAQSIGNHHADEHFIINHKDFAAVRQCFLQWNTRCLGRCNFARVARQINGHLGPLVRSRFDSDSTTGLTGEAINHRKAEPGALLLRFGGEERLEHMADNIGVDANPVVRHADSYVIPRLKRFIPRRSRFKPAIFPTNFDLAAARQGVAGIDAQVEQGVFELVGVHQGRPDFRCRMRLNCDCRTRSSFYQLGDIGYQPVDHQRLG